MQPECVAFAAVFDPLFERSYRVEHIRPFATAEMSYSRGKKQTSPLPDPFGANHSTRLS
jgi:hypothetical protein